MDDTMREPSRERGADSQRAPNGGPVPESLSATPVTRDEIETIIAGVLSRMGHAPSADELRLRAELGSLLNFIRAARVEIGALRPEQIRNEYIAVATDELDAVVGATEEATGRILDAAEQILAVASTLGGPEAAQLTDLATAIFEASNFQDITGQRISKVVRTLKHIEAKISELAGVFGAEALSAMSAPQQPAERPAAASAPAGTSEPRQLSDAELLNGPQLPGNAIDQSEIDRLLAG